MEEKTELNYFVDCVKLIWKLAVQFAKTGSTVVVEKTKIYGKYAVIMAYFATILGLCLKLINKIAKD